MDNTSLLTWMAWTGPTVLFFLYIFGSIAAMGVWEYFSPGGAPRRGVFGLDTTRGDRLFIGLLTAAYINLAWVGLAGQIAQWLSLENEPSIWISFVASMGVLGLVMRKG